MSAVALEPEVKRGTGGGGSGVLDDDHGRGGDGGRGEGGGEPQSFDSQRLGLWLLLATITMLFAAFTSSLLVRRAAGDWVALAVPPVLWLNTALLVASSVTVDLARRRILAGNASAFRRWFAATIVLGVAFLVGQLQAWEQLAAAGWYVSSSPHSSFVYLLTGAHGVHVLGGLLALVYVGARAWRNSYTPSRCAGPRLAATYWHFVDGLWVYVFVVLFVI